MLRTCIVAGFALCGTMLAHLPAGAQRVDQTLIIELHLNAETENRAIGGSVPEGKSFRITFNDVGSFEVVPVVVDEARGTFRVTIYRGPVGAEMADMRAVETVSARTGVPVALRSMPAVGLVIDGVRRAAPRAAAGTASMISFASSTGASLAGLAAQDRCCISCGNMVACGCKVTGDCGFCCVDPCCPEGIILTSADAFLPQARTFASMSGQCGTSIRDEERIHTSPAQRTVVASR